MPELIHVKAAQFSKVTLELVEENIDVAFDIDNVGGLLHVTASTRPGVLWIVSPNDDDDDEPALNRGEPGVSRPVRVQRGRAATVEVLDLGADDEGWQVRSEDLVELWGLRHGPEADEVVTTILGQQAPELLAAVELDSFDSTFSAYLTNGEQAEELAAILRTDT